MQTSPPQPEQPEIPADVFAAEDPLLPGFHLAVLLGALVLAIAAVIVDTTEPA